MKKTKVKGMIVCMIIFGALVVVLVSGIGASPCNSNESVNNMIVDSSGYGKCSFEIQALIGVWLEQGIGETEVFVGSDEVGVTIWEDQKRNCWLEQKRLDIFVDTCSEEEFDVCGCFLLTNGRTINITLCSVNTSAVRGEL